MTSPMDRHLSIRQELALRALAFFERTNMAEQRRRAIRARADQALENPRIAEAVDAIAEAQIKRAVARLSGEDQP